MTRWEVEVEVGEEVAEVQEHSLQRLNCDALCSHLFVSCFALAGDGLMGVGGGGEKCLLRE